ncbi:winged helix domain-containing protein [Oceanicaulis sp.]|uniref:winged helix domain-containing protein n=1 Tax=Oceanicaulis sp. TaxID=1924941 RepID=UPI003BAD1587
MRESISVSFPTEPKRPTIIVSGRNAWALLSLDKAGAKGLTPLTTPAPRWSAYVHNLRRMGFNIETISERHGPPFPGTHARYVLREIITVRALAPEGGGA